SKLIILQYLVTSVADGKLDFKASHQSCVQGFDQRSRAEMSGSRLKCFILNFPSEVRKRPRVVIVVLIVLGIILWSTPSDKVLSLRERLIAVPCENDESKHLIEDVVRLSSILKDTFLKVVGTL
ncbi:hypothetical protein EGW08_008047, partial [Elysia chlorotica]